MSMPTPQTARVVQITAVDLANRKADGMTRTHVTVPIDLSYHIGASVITPAVGESWMIERADMGFYRLDRKLQTNAPELLTDAVQGQVHVGSSGPLELNGTQVNANAPLRLPADLPNPATVDAGALAYDGDPVVSDGVAWRGVITTTGRLRIWRGSAAQYTAIDPKDPDTLYIVT